MTIQTVRYSTPWDKGPYTFTYGTYISFNEEINAPEPIIYAVKSMT